MWRRVVWVAEDQVKVWLNDVIVAVPVTMTMTVKQGQQGGE